MTSAVSRVDELRPSVNKRAEEVETLRRLPDDLLDTLTRAGCFRMLVPARHGGDELSLVEALGVLEELARGDGSCAWLVGQVALADLLFACFPEAAREEVYAGGPDVLGAGAVAPKGRAAPDGEGGWRVNGRWPFVTGCTTARWIYLNCVVLDGHAVRLLPNGAPQTRITLFPADEVEIHDTWHVLGLRGTASHDVQVAHLRCPDRRGFSLGGGAEGRAAVYSIAQAGLLIAAVDLGIGQGALDDVAQLLAAGKRRAFGAAPLARSTVVRDRLGEAHVGLRAARALLHQEARDAWSAARDGRVATPLERACLRATAARVTALAAEAVDTAHALAGGAAVYESSPLQRRLRDIHTATQHFVNGREMYGTVGALLAGEEVDTSMF